MRIVLVALVLLTSACASTVVHGPQSCNEAVVDEFDRTQRGASYDTQGTGYRIGLFQRGQSVTLVSSWSTAGAAQFEIPAGTPIDVALGNGATLQVRTSTAAAPIINGNAYGAATHWNVETELGPEELTVLSEVPIIAARLRIQGIEMTMNTYLPTRAGLQNLAICYVNNY